MAKAPLNTNQFINDIRSGLHDDDLLAKHSISLKQLRVILKTLLGRGQISSEDLSRRKDYFFKRIRKLAIIAMFSDDDLMQRLVLKGGNAMDIAYSMEFRSSIDLDFSMNGDFAPGEKAAIKLKVERCLEEAFRPEGYEVFDVTFTEKPPETTPDMADFWGGYLIEFKIIKRNKYKKLAHDLDFLRKTAEEVDTDSKKKFRIEISKFEDCVRKREKEIDHYTIYVYSPEQIVVEKIRSICQQMPEYRQIVKSRSQSSRPKDFLDIFVTMKHFDIDLTTPDNIDLMKCSFASKRVPLELIGKIRYSRDYHREGFEAVKDTVYRRTNLEEFDFYFDYVVAECRKLKALWEE